MQCSALTKASNYTIRCKHQIRKQQITDVKEILCYQHKNQSSKLIFNQQLINQLKAIHPQSITRSMSEKMTNLLYSKNDYEQPGILYIMKYGEYKNKDNMLIKIGITTKQTTRKRQQQIASRCKISLKILEEWVVSHPRLMEKIVFLFLKDQTCALECACKKNHTDRFILPKHTTANGLLNFNTLVQVCKVLHQQFQDPLQH